MSWRKANRPRFVWREEDPLDVFYEDWFITHVGGFLEFDDLGRWDVAMSSKREKWLKALSNVKIPDIDDYEHRYNESVRWLITRRIQHVTKIAFDEYPENEISSKTFTGARALVNLTSIHLRDKVTDPILSSLKVNCRNLEELSIVCDSVGDTTTFDAAARLVEKLPRLRDFTFTCSKRVMKNSFHEGEAVEQSSSPLLVALGQNCPLLETLDLAKYDDEGLAELVVGCRRLHTLTIDADTYGVSLIGFRTLGKSRSITTLNINTRAIHNDEHCCD